MAGSDTLRFNNIESRVVALEEALDRVNCGLDKRIDELRLDWAQHNQAHCPKCGRKVQGP